MEATPDPNNWEKNQQKILRRDLQNLRVDEVLFAFFEHVNHIRAVPNTFNHHGGIFEISSAEALPKWFDLHIYFSAIFWN